MTIQHVDITDPMIHEPKGITAASANTVYVSNGAGSGAWSSLTTDSLDWTNILAELEEAVETGAVLFTGYTMVTGILPDISDAGSQCIISIPRDCTIVNFSVTLGGSLSVADATVNFLDSSGASLSAPLIIGFDGSGKGDTYFATASGNNELTGPTWIEVVTDGGSTGSVPLYITITLQYVINAG